MRRLHPLIYVVVALWALLVSVGAARLWHYSGTPGAAAHPPGVWPAESRAVRAAHLPALVLLIHPNCPCSRATLGELARIMTECGGKVTASVMVLDLPPTPAVGANSTLWKDAASIPGVTVLADEGGREAQRFRAATSGQALLYDPDGRLLFAGGITEARGHSGDNAGRSAVVSLIQDAARERPAATARTPVYGCPLFDQPATCELKGGKACCQ